MREEIAIVEMVRRNGQIPFARWFDRLDAAHAAKVVTAVTLLRQGNTSNTKPVVDGVWAYRINWGQGIRIYFGWDGTTIIVLLGGGTKRRQQKDIEAAKSLWCEYKQNKQGR